MSFLEFLDANNLPHIGEIVVTPGGLRVEVERYTFDQYDDYVSVRLIDSEDCVIEWMLDQLKLCTREEI